MENVTFDSIDKWNVVSYTKDALEYIRMRSKNPNITHKELMELVNAAASIKRFIETKNREEGETVRKYAIKSCNYKIKAYNRTIASHSH